MSRTIVVSDIHGEPAVLARALECSGFVPGADRLVVAGDIVGAEPGGYEAALAVEAAGAEVLVGNHEPFFFGGTTLDEKGAVDPRLFALVRERILSGAWLLAAEADGVLITHAGLSRDWADLFAQLEWDRKALAAELNRLWAAEVPGLGSPGGLLEGAGVVGQGGPLWFRASGADEPLPGIVQVVGHTPRELYHDPAKVAELAAAGFHLTDPFVRGWRAEGRPVPPPCRFAVIEGGRVEVREG